MTAIAGYKASVYVSTGVSTAQSNGAMTDAGDHKTFTVTTSAQRYWDTTVALTVQTEEDEIQTVTITGAPTGGTFTLTFGANTTSAIAYNASAATVQAALVALASIGANNATVSGSAGGPWTVEFTSALGFSLRALITGNGGSLTGGASPSVSIVEANAGSTWTTQASGFVVQYCGGIVTFTNALSTGTVNCRVSYNWLTVSQAAQAKSIEIQSSCDIYDISTLGGGAWKQKLVGLAAATIKLSQFWVDVFYISSLGGLLIVAAYTGANSNQRLECYAYIKQDDIKIDVAAVEEESIDLEANGPIYYIAS